MSGELDWECKCGRTFPTWERINAHLEAVAGQVHAAKCGIVERFDVDK